MKVRMKFFFSTGLLIGGTCMLAYSLGLPAPPDAVNDTPSTNKNVISDIPVLDNDSDLNSDSLSVIGVSDPLNGVTSINPDNTVHYIPDLDFIGTDTFTYTISDGTDESEIKLTASQAAIDDRYGLSLDVSGDLAVIGASTDEDTSGVDDSGVVYVLRRSGTSWVEEAILSASDPNFNAQFGKDVAVDGGLIVVGAYKNDGAADNAGAAYIFRWNGASWVEEQKLTASDAVADDEFGRFVGISGNTIAVGVWQDDDAGLSSGSAYVFQWNGSSWVEEAKLTASDAAAGDEFGRNLAISGDVVVAGAGPDTNAGGIEVGAAYVYRRSGSTWSEEAKLTASDPGDNDWFGRAVAIDVDTIVVSAVRDDDNGGGSGSTYVFEWDGSSWTETHKLTASDGTAGDRFGDSVDVYRNLIVVGAGEDDELGVGAGSAYLFQRNASSWIEHRKLTASDAAVGDSFGAHAAVNGNTVLVGAHNKDSMTGSAYVYPIGTDTATVTVTVNSGTNNPPVVDTPIPDQSATQGVAMNLDVSGNFSDPDGDTLTFSMSGRPTNSGISISAAGVISGTPTQTDVDASPISLTIIATDTELESVSDTFDLDVANVNDSPTLANLIPDQSITEDTLFSFTFAANTFDDIDGDTLIYTATLVGGAALPTWLGFDGPARTFSGTPANGDVGTISVEVAADDGNGSTVTDQFDITVDNVNDAPLLDSPIGPQSATQGVALNIDLSGNFSDPDGDTLTYSMSGRPANSGISITGDGTISGTPTQVDVDASPISLTITATDPDLESVASNVFTLDVTNTNDAPVVSSPVDDFTVTQSVPFNQDVSANFVDPDGDTLTFSVSGLPAGSGVAITTAGVITGTPTQADVDVSPISVTVTASDPAGETASDTLSLTVTDRNDTPVLIAPIPSQAGTQGTVYGPLGVSGNFSDPDGDVLSFSISGLPAGSGLAISSDGVISGTPSNADAMASPMNLTVTATDPVVVSASGSFTFTVDNINDAPVVITSIGAQSASEEVAFGPLDISGNFSDPDGDELTFSMSGLPAGSGLTISVGGVIGGTPTSADVTASPVNVTVTATDTSTAAVSSSFVLTVSPVDSNADGISDDDAIALGLDPNDPDGDSDNDGISDVIEIGGDINNPLDNDGDGVIDALEEGVAAADASTADNVAVPGGTVDIISVGQMLSGVASGPATGGPAGIAFPFGTISFKTTSPIGGSVTVRLVFDQLLPSNLALYKVDGNGVYTELPASVWSRIDSNTVELTLTDGDPLTDQDATANGEIDDPVAPADLGAPASTGSDGGGGGCTLSPQAAKDPTFPLLMLISIGYLVRRRANVK